MFTCSTLSGVKCLVFSHIGDWLWIIQILTSRLVVSVALQHGPVYKLAFGPKSFVVVSDPIVARYILRENAFNYDKVFPGFHGSFNELCTCGISV